MVSEVGEISDYYSDMEIQEGITEEIWMAIPGYEGIYTVSNLGRVKALSRMKNSYQGMKLHKEVNRKAIVSKRTGYQFITLINKGDCKNCSVHRLVAITFIPNPYNKPQVNHKNGIKTDNRLENLEWVTPSENKIHSFKIGTSKAAFGTNNAWAKLTPAKVRIIRKSNKSQRKLAKELGVAQSSVWRILTGKTWRHVK